MEESDSLKSALRQWILLRQQALLEFIMASWRENPRNLEPDDALLAQLCGTLPGIPASRGPKADLGGAMDAIEAAPSQGEVLRALLDGLRPFSERSALFIVKQGLPSLYAARGFEPEEPKLGTPVMPTRQLEALLGGSLHAIRGTGEVYDSMLVPLSRVRAPEALILPLRLRRKTVALLLVDCGQKAELGRAADLRALAHTAESCLSFLAGQKEDERSAPAEAAPPPAPVPVPHPLPEPAPAYSEAVPPLDPKIRATAERLARVLGGDIELYFPQKLALGQAQGNIYTPLREELDRSRATFVDRYGEEVENQHRIFATTIIQQLCAGDPARLGPAPWAPKG